MPEFGGEGRDAQYPRQAAQFLVLASVGAVANASAIGWRLSSFLVGSAIIFKSPAGIALAAGFSLAQAFTPRLASRPVSA